MGEINCSILLASGASIMAMDDSFYCSLATSYCSLATSSGECPDDATSVVCTPTHTPYQAGGKGPPLIFEQGNYSRTFIRSLYMASIDLSLLLAPCI